MDLVSDLDGIKGFIVDLDGVVYLRHELIPGADLFVREVQASGRKLAFLTNNSTRTRAQYVSTLSDLGIPAREEDIVTSSYATALYLSRKAPGSRVYVVGQSGLIRELSRAGLDVMKQPPADFVVVGIDDDFNYGKLRTASSLIRSGSGFIATNTDATYPTESGPLPGAGSMVSAVRVASERRPTVIGKPSRWIFRIALDILDLAPEEVAVVGDRLETDIKGGLDMGMKTILVLSGVTPENPESSDITPHLTYTSIADMVLRG